jgi:hypothetical protein
MSPSGRPQCGPSSTIPNTSGASSLTATSQAITADGPGYAVVFVEFLDDCLHPASQQNRTPLDDYLAHFAIGVGLAVPFVLGWDLWVGGPASPVWALLYGVATTAASFFFVYPSMGLGVFGWRSPERMKAFLTPLANHLFYGAGLAVGLSLV